MRAVSTLLLALGCTLALAGCPKVDDRPDSGVVPYDRTTGNPFDAPLSLSDTRVLSLDPASVPSTPSACHAPVVGVVERIVDGDTLHVTVPADGMSYDVRMIGVDTPEIEHGDGGPPADCYGNQAFAFTELLRGRAVVLTFDAGCRDPFDRLLAYVWVGSGPGDLWQRQLLRRGYARTLSIEPNTAMASTFAEDQGIAETTGTGLWGACP